MMNSRVDVCVIGGGLVGCFAALFLTRRGRSVALIEKSAIGGEASGVNFGNLRLQGRNRTEFPMSLAAHDLWEQFEGLTGESCDFAACGHAYLAFGANDQPTIEQYAHEANAAGIGVDVLDAAAVRRRWPALATLVTGATWSPRDAVADPARATPAVARAAQRCGADIREATHAIEIRRSTPGLRVCTDLGSTIDCDWVVNTAGAWAGRICGALGEPVPMFAAGPPIVMTEPVAALGLPSMLAIDGSIIFRQGLDGSVVTSSFPRSPADLESGAPPVPPERVKRDLARLAEVVPVLRYCTAVRAWSGVEGYLPDMLPVLGRSRTTPGVIHAFGFSGHGYQLSPAVGRVLADLVIDGATQIPISAFAIDRFVGHVRPDERIWREFEPGLVARAHQSKGDADA